MGVLDHILMCQINVCLLFSYHIIIYIFGGDVVAQTISVGEQQLSTLSIIRGSQIEDVFHDL
jgi:hypothetical protein